LAESDARSVRPTGHQSGTNSSATAFSRTSTFAHPSVLSPDRDCLANRPSRMCAARADWSLLAHPNRVPTESQRGRLRLPCGALSAANLNTRCPSVPHRVPRSDGLEMRYTASSGVEGSNPSRSAFPYIEPQVRGRPLGDRTSKTGGLVHPDANGDANRCQESVCALPMSKRTNGKGTVGSRPLVDGRRQGSLHDHRWGGESRSQGRLRNPRSGREQKARRRGGRRCIDRPSLEAASA
jgi:hypothetical protein